MEDHVWRAAGMTSRVSGLFGNENALPMYKDKPYSYAASRRNRPFWRRRTTYIFVLAVVGFLYWFGAFSKHEDQRLPRQKWNWVGSQDSGKSKADWLGRRERVVEAFQLSWDSYQRYAWGKDSSQHKCCQERNYVTDAER
jgi:endoplasmic reticulum Man9GlcNAc2 1,2-alpha-mannosidase